MMTTIHYVHVRGDCSTECGRGRGLVTWSYNLSYVTCWGCLKKTSEFAERPSARDRVVGERARAMLVIPPPATAFRSEGGREFTVGPGEYSERWPCDPLWNDAFPILHRGHNAGTLWRSAAYGLNTNGSGRWHGTIVQLRWANTPTLFEQGYIVEAFDTAEECLAAWGRSADQILDRAEGRGQ